MRALILDGTWDPRPGYPLTDDETRRRRARVASQVWRHPAAALAEVDDPPLADDEVRVQVGACGVCGSDTHCVETDEQGYLRFSGPTRLPVVLGHEYAGEVVEIGAAVTAVAVGDLVAAEGMLWCGLCEPCRSGLPNQCVRLEMLGFSAPGAFAERVVTRERYCWSLAALREPLGDERALELGALLEPAGCSYNGLYVAAGGFRPGATAVIWGAGPIGLAAIPVALAGGASRIWAFDPIPERVALARAMGADDAFDPADGDPAARILEQTGGRGADVHVECAGAAAQTFPAIERCLAPAGKVIYLGRTGERAPVEADRYVTGAHALVGSRGHAGGGVFPSLIRLVAAGRIDLGPMITARFGLGEVLAALERSRARTDGKILVRP